jgi:hypothetical protein
MCVNAYLHMFAAKQQILKWNSSSKFKENITYRQFDATHFGDMSRIDDLVKFIECYNFSYIFVSYALYQKQIQ